ncbi:MAG: TraI/MobA(P) family conjugative relaxase [Desulfobulbus sp.]|jgi:hypothetical protein
MIAKKIEAGTKDEKGRIVPRDYAKLGNYILDASHQGEKCLMSWQAGCYCEETDLALAEIKAVQSMNTRTRKDKTYHLIISFHPEDEAKLTPEIFRDIERQFAAALGLADHQRLCGVHQNTHNMHMHVAYNLIHPERLTIHEPFQDFFKLAQTCRELETRFGLVTDPGPEPDEPKRRIAQRANAMEAHSGEQSFQSFALERKSAIVAAMIDATSWQDAHRVFARYGMEITPHGNGFSIKNSDGKEALKASSLDRSLSKKKLEARLGPFQKLADGDRPSAEEKYTRTPLQPKNPVRDALYQEFCSMKAERTTLIEAEKARRREVFDGLKARWARAKKQLYLESASRQTRAARMRLMLEMHRREVAKAKEESRRRMTAAKEKFPFHNWHSFLEQKALGGDLGALCTLRSIEAEDRRKAAITNPALEKTWLIVPFAEKDAAKAAGAKWDRKGLAWYAPKGADLDKLDRWLESKSPHAQSWRRYSAADRMKRLAASSAAPLFAGFRQRIDHQGIVIFTLPGGGLIRDAGTKIFFSKDEKTRKAVSLYALAKFGKSFKMKGNSIEKNNDRQKQIHQPHLGILKKSARYGLRPVSQLPVVSDRRKRCPVLLSDHAQSHVER